MTRPRYLVCTLWLSFVVVQTSRSVFADPGLTGEQIYQRQCASCHGAAGEGSADHYGKPLAGDRPLGDLTHFIDEMMPEDEPEKCTGADAEQVAAYVYDAFYSPAAQARHNRPRIELSRLTVRQYQNTVADLIGSFAEAGRWDGERGLRGEYFKDKRLRNDQRIIDRRDATVDFNFGEASPSPDKIEKSEFAIRWQGAVLAPETGDYEFIVRTENGARLWVNDTEQPLIDAWVKSGSDPDHRGSLRLLGGRVYPLRLEFFKSKEGKETTASVALLWQPPHQVAAVIPERNLSPNRFRSTLVVQTSFPPDDRSTGYERGTSISREWDEATTYAAIEVARYVVANLPQLAGSRDQPRVRQFCQRFVEKAFRRPLTDEQRQFFVDRRYEGAADVDDAVKKVVLLALKSPRFLYREATADRSDQYDVAARLSFGLWDSLPDQQLFDAAARGQLATSDQVLRQAERMVDDLRTRAKLREFFHQWLKVDRIEDLAKDGELYPDFSAEIASDLRTSLDLFLDDVAWSDRSDFRQLLLADSLYVNGRLAKFYGAELPADAEFQKVSFDPTQRSGVLSHPFLLAGFAYHSTSSPIHRGVFISRGLLGRALRPPPEAVTPLSPELHQDLTTRERVALQTSPLACANCHAMINPLGFPLEHYDAVGRYRSEEQGRPIDATGSYHTLTGEDVEFTGVRELATFLAASPETHDAFVRQLFQYLVKQPLGAYGPDQPDKLSQAFARQEFSIRRLLLDAVTLSAQTAK